MYAETVSAVVPVVIITDDEQFSGRVVLHRGHQLSSHLLLMVPSSLAVMAMSLLATEIDTQALFTVTLPPLPMTGSSSCITTVSDRSSSALFKRDHSPHVDNMCSYDIMSTHSCIYSKT